MGLSTSSSLGNKPQVFHSYTDGGDFESDHRGSVVISIL